jgi:iron complex transport system substrate-binding protein
MSLFIREGGRRSSVAITGLALALVALNACGSAKDARDPAAPADGAKPTATTGTADAEPFPVRIKSALGTAEIPERPERVVTLGQGSTETAIALGVIPVGIEKYPWGSDKSGYLPWVHEAVTKAGGKLPEQFTGGTELDIEAVLKLHPDVILAPWSGITQEQFDLLGDIAPTVAYPDKAWSTNWDQQIRTIGTALGKEQGATQQIDKINEHFSQVRAAHPEFAKHSFAYIYNTGPGTLGVFLPDEQRVAMLRKMGLRVDPVVNTLPESEGTDSSVLGLENADKLKNADLLFTFYMDVKSRKQIESQPLYAGIPAIKRGSLVTSNDRPFVTASSMINPLTVPWSIERYVPMISKALRTVER